MSPKTFMKKFAETLLKYGAFLLIFESGNICKTHKIKLKVIFSGILWKRKF